MVAAQQDADWPVHEADQHQGGQQQQRRHGGLDVAQLHRQADRPEHHQPHQPGQHGDQIGIVAHLRHTRSPCYLCAHDTAIQRRVTRWRTQYQRLISSAAKISPQPANCSRLMVSPYQAAASSAVHTASSIRITAAWLGVVSPWALTCSRKRRMLASTTLAASQPRVTPPMRAGQGSTSAETSPSRMPTTVSWIAVSGRAGRRCTTRELTLIKIEKSTAETVISAWLASMRSPAFSESSAKPTPATGRAIQVVRGGRSPNSSRAITGTSRMPRLLMKALSPRCSEWYRPRIQKARAALNSTPTPAPASRSRRLRRRSTGRAKPQSTRPASRKREAMNSSGGMPFSASLEKIQPAAASAVTRSSSRSARRGERALGSSIGNLVGGGKW